MRYPTYKEQFDKLTEAYISGKVYPWACCACFVGNLLNGRTEWDSFTYLNKNDTKYIQALSCLTDECNNLYNPEHIVKMEWIFLDEIRVNTYPQVANRHTGGMPLSKVNHPNYEYALWRAFSKTLEYLKQIHIESGENVEGNFELKKRELCKEVSPG